MQPQSEVIPISVATGQQWEPLVVGGITYRQSPLSAIDLGKLEAWVKSQFPDPVATGKRLAEGLPLELAREVIERAQDQANNPRWCLGTTAASQMLRSVSGMIELLTLTLAKHHPDLKRSDIEQIVADITNSQDEDLEDVADRAESVALAQDPNAPPLETFGDPKAVGATGP